MATMDMDEQLFRLQHGWSLPLKSDQGIRVMPGPKEASLTLCLTDVFLVEPETAAGHGVLAVCVEIGTLRLVLAELSSEKPREVLQTPVVLDEEFSIYMMRAGGDADANAVVVQFQGYARPSPNTTEEDHEEDGGDRIDEEDGKGHEEDGEDAMGSDYEEDEDEGRYFGGPAPPGLAFGVEHSGQVAAPEASVLRIFAVVYLMAMVALVVYVCFFGG